AAPSSQQVVPPYQQPYPSYPQYPPATPPSQQVASPYQQQPPLYPQYPPVAPPQQVPSRPLTLSELKEINRVITWGIVPSEKGRLYGGVALGSLVLAFLLSFATLGAYGYVYSYSPVSIVLWVVCILACIPYYREAGAYVRVKTGGRC